MRPRYIREDTTLVTFTKLELGDAEIARIGLVTNRLNNTPAKVAFIQAAAAAGVGMIDTAHSYTSGESEATIGAALSPVPDNCIVATKSGAGGAGRGRRENLRAEIDESLRRLRIDSIGLFYLHRVASLADLAGFGRGLAVTST